MKKHLILLLLLTSCSTYETPPVAFNGRLVDTNNNPVPNAKIRLSVDSFSWMPPYGKKPQKTLDETRTNESGEFRLLLNEDMARNMLIIRHINDPVVVAASYRSARFSYSKPIKNPNPFVFHTITLD